MEIIDRVIKKQVVPNIVADRNEFKRIFDDMRQCAGPFLPAPTWLLCQHPDNIAEGDLSQIVEVAASDAVFEKEFADLSKRMEGWVGYQKVDISDRSVASIVADYAVLLDRDPLGLWHANVEDDTVASSLTVADLGSIMDLNFLYAHAFDPGREVTRILEIGGGYGRLAEAAFNVFGRSIRYVLMDSVPVSLYYAKEYMERACPEICVGSYYDGDPFDLNKFDCYIIPSWHFEKLNRETYDICVNIESFQEMLQEHVDTYLNLFDRVARMGATMYISNAHDYIFKGTWNYPLHWLKVICANTPRSWSPDHPTEIFVKGDRDVSARNVMVDDIHRYFVSRQNAVSSPVAPTVGDHIERLAGKRVRASMRMGLTQLNSVLTKLVALRQRDRS
jgi:putative sugar O-methyltransferase